MLTNAFTGAKDPPTDAELTAAPGPARAAWDRLLVLLAQNHDVTVHEWKG
jgi:hypothetical protein